MISWDCRHTLPLAKKRQEHGPSRADTPPPKPRELFTQISNVASLNVKLLAMMTLLNPEVTLPPRKKVYFVSKEKNTSWKKEMFFCSNSMSSLRNPCNFYSI
jgi:hypothetical protein